MKPDRETNGVILGTVLLLSLAVQLPSCISSGEVQERVRGTAPPSNFTGIWTTWYEHGEKAFESSYENGGRHGIWKHWHPNGFRAYEGSYREGKSEGKWTWWRADGSPRSERHYKNGRAHGPVTEWDENGNILSVQHFTNGVVTLLEHYENGHLARKETPPTYEEHAQTVRRKVANIKIGMTRAQVEQIIREPDGGVSGNSASRYYEGWQVMVRVPYDQTGGNWRVNGPVRVYRSSMALD